MPPPKRGLGVMDYGIPGIGKTKWALEWPKPLYCFSLGETGFADFEYTGDLPPGCTGFTPPDYESFYNMLVQIINSKEKPRTIVIDSVSGFQQMFFDWLITSAVKNNQFASIAESTQKFWAYFKGPRAEAPNAVPQFTAILSAFLNSGVNIVLLGHKKNETEENEAGADHMKAVIDLDVGIRNCFYKWAPNIFYMTLNATITTATKSGGFGANQTILEGKTSGVAERWMYTSTNPQNDAKNKLNLPSIITMGQSSKEAFDNFWKLVPAVYKGE